MMRLFFGLIGLATIGMALPASAATSAASKACSEQADARNLHGADRDAFRTQCMKATAPIAPAAEAKSATTTKAAATTTTTSTTKAATSDLSKSCSAQADAKGLHGAERDSFRTACMKGATPAPVPVKAVAPVAAPVAATTTTTKATTTTSTKAAPSEISKSCSTQADAKGLHGAERDSFRTACMKSAPGIAPVAKPVAPMAATTTTTKATTKTVDTGPVLATPSGGKPLSPAQEAANARIKDCGEQWRTAKAANKIPAGQTWPQYWSACSARMKAAGK